MTQLSRWRPRPQHRAPGQDAGWLVVAEDGREDYGPASPRVHGSYCAALRRSDELNRAEQYAAIGAEVPR